MLCPLLSEFQHTEKRTRTIHNPYAFWVTQSSELDISFPMPWFSDHNKLYQLFSGYYWGMTLSSPSLPQSPMFSTIHSFLVWCYHRWIHHRTEWAFRRDPAAKGVAEQIRHPASTKSYTRSHLNTGFLQFLTFNTGFRPWAKHRVHYT